MIGKVDFGMEKMPRTRFSEAKDLNIVPVGFLQHAPARRHGMDVPTDYATKNNLSQYQ
jgi:hypothetical protein